AATAADAAPRPVGHRARPVRPRAHHPRGLRPAPRDQGAHRRMSGLDGLDQPGLDGLDQPGSTAAKRVVMVAAVARNGVIGLDGDIPWSIPEDLKHFRATTKGHTVLMGRSTYESIGHPLPYRTNVVITRRPDWSADGVLVAHSVEEGLELARGLDG